MNIKRDLWFIIVTVLFIGWWAFQLTRFNKGSYTIQDKDLVRIDSIKTLTKAFKEPHGKGATGSYDLLFKDITGKEFRYSVLAPLNFDDIWLTDTLQYTNVVLSVTVTPKGYATYYDKTSSSSITVHAIIIGNRHISNIDADNDSKRTGISLSLVLTLLGYLVCLVYYFYKRQS